MLLLLLLAAAGAAGAPPATLPRHHDQYNKAQASLFQPIGPQRGFAYVYPQPCLLYIYIYKYIYRNTQQPTYFYR
jgi:hypothetical protein